VKTAMPRHASCYVAAPRRTPRPARCTICRRFSPFCRRRDAARRSPYDGHPPPPEKEMLHAAARRVRDTTMIPRRSSQRSVYAPTTLAMLRADAATEHFTALRAPQRGVNRIILRLNRQTPDAHVLQHDDAAACRCLMQTARTR